MVQPDFVGQGYNYHRRYRKTDPPHFTHPFIHLLAPKNKAPNSTHTHGLPIADGQ